MKIINFRFYIFIFVIILGNAVFSSVALASQLYFDASSSVFVGQDFTARLFIDPQNENINAIEGKVVYSPNISIKSISTAGSIIGNWIINPVDSLKSGDKSVKFSGIIPGGYSGTLSSEWSGAHPGVLFKMTFSPQQVGQAFINLENQAVLLNNGQATTASSSVQNKSISILNQSFNQNFVGAPTSSEDKNPPDEFTPIVSSDPLIDNGKFFVIFNAIDRTSGIVGYQVTEKRGDLASDYSNLPWNTAISPYVLKDQALKSYIYVKAIDGFGNERVEIISPKNKLSWYDNNWIWILFLIIFSAIILFVFVMRKNRKFNQRGE